jgi:hypothetical protein
MTHSKVYDLFKYVVYALLAFNIAVFFSEEWAASAHRFVNGVNFSQIIEAFAATIDTAAWVVLLLMFELETHVLEDHHFTRKVTIALHSLRAICYAFILYAFYGYLTKLLFQFGVTAAPDINDLCALVADQWSFAIDYDEFEAITTANCNSLSDATVFFQFPNINSVIDQAGKTDLLRLAWVDVINAGVWLLVVVVLEIDVRLQDRNLLIGTALRISNLSKYVLYGTLFLAAIYWGVKGDFVDFWDAFLWLVAFIFIELNVFEWQQESLRQTAEATAGKT